MIVTPFSFKGGEAEDDDDNDEDFDPGLPLDEKKVLAFFICIRKMKRLHTFFCIEIKLCYEFRAKVIKPAIYFTECSKLSIQIVFVIFMPSMCKDGYIVCT